MKCMLLVLFALVLISVVVASDLTQAEKALLKAAEKGDLTKAQEAISAGAGVNCRGKYSWTPLHWVATKRNAEVARLLLENGANANVADEKWGVTPLMYAASEGDCLIMDLLIRHNADVNARTKNKDTALMFAAGRGQVEAVRLLVEKGADIEAVDDKGKTALIYAEKGLGFFTDGALDYLHPEAKYGRSQVVAYLRSAISRQVATEHPSLDLLSRVDFKILDSSGDLSTISWRLFIISNIKGHIKIAATIQFVDNEGFALKEWIEPEIELQEKIEKSLTGTVLMKTSLATKISRATSIFTRLE